MRALGLLLIVVAGCGRGAASPPATGGDGSGAGGSGAGGNGALDADGGAPDGDGGTMSTPPAADPCAAATLGDGSYCGSELAGGDAATLYHCAGAKTASSEHCAMGCHVAPPGTPDYCDDGGLYHYPWTCGASYETTQGNGGDICGGGTGDHTGVQQYAWDFGLPRHTVVRASRGGTVTLVANVTAAGQACYDGCTQPFGSQAFWDCCNGCINTSNHVNVQHADGTVATYWHLDVATATKGAHVNAGDVIGYSGTSGCSSGPHLHFQVMGDCPTGYCQSIAIAFAGNEKPACGNVEKSDNACQ
jgi:hypothetical protein